MTKQELSLWLIGAFAFGIVVCQLVDIALAAPPFEMTDQQKQEENLLLACENINASKIFIEALNKPCWEIYGGPVN